ncbi:Hypothetical protein AA314_06613 [Archangium gephyra]|uniref:Uncharacterized protein n=1 Tax=Archangium gephyra TaxID=48 RepID=A0AAC8QC64_9BACT|nr:Hypothetical protein AA314_06613 [Archangium gephyra]
MRWRLDLQAGSRKNREHRHTRNITLWAFMSVRIVQREWRNMLWRSASSDSGAERQTFIETTILKRQEDETHRKTKSPRFRRT